MRHAVCILVLAACDAGAPAPAPSPPTPAIARPIDAATIIEMDGPRAAIDLPEAFTATRLEPIAALPSDWKHLLSLRELSELEVGSSNGRDILVAREGHKLYATAFSTVANETVGSWHGRRTEDGRGAAILVFTEHDHGRQSFALACGQGPSRAWSCSPPIPLEDADLRSDLIFMLGAAHGSLEIPATAQTPERRYQITYP